MPTSRSAALAGLVATLGLASLVAGPAAGSSVPTTWKLAFVETRNIKPPGSRPPGPVFRNTLFVVNGDGSGRKLLASSIHSGFDAPSWSPDGRRLAYAKRPGSGGSDSSAVFVIDADGSGQRNASRNPARDFGPQWSPNGRKIAFLRERRTGHEFRAGGYHELWVMNTDGSGQRKLTDDTLRYAGSGASPKVSSSARWSPDSRKLLFDRDGDGEIWVMNADGSDQRNLTSDPTFDSQPAWSPDGRTIVFVSDRGGNGDIYAMNADGSPKRNFGRLTSDPAADFAPAWSPDGKRIVFVSTRDGFPEIYVMNAHGGEKRRLTRSTAGEETPAWSPDGRTIGFVRNHDIYVMNADGTGQRNLTRTPAQEHSFAWSPAQTARLVRGGDVTIACEGPWGPEANRRPQRGTCRVTGAITDRGRFADSAIMGLNPHRRTLALQKGTIELTVYLARGHWEIEGGTRSYARLQGRGWEARSTGPGPQGLHITMKGTVSR